MTPIEKLVTIIKDDKEHAKEISFACLGFGPFMLLLLVTKLYLMFFILVAAILASWLLAVTAPTVVENMIREDLEAYKKEKSRHDKL